VAADSHKVVRSYRVVFRRRWRIFRLQGWRIPLPNGLELRVIGYWLACLAAILLFDRLPGLGVLIAAIPESMRLLALPVAAAWFLSKWEIDGRSPHRALVGLAGYWLRPRSLAGLRAAPPEGTVLTPVHRLSIAPDLYGSSYPRGRLVGPARVLLRYPVTVRPAGPRCWHLRATGAPALHRGRTLEVPHGREVVFE
jgi:hypothetical protein